MTHEDGSKELHETRRGTFLPWLDTYATRVGGIEPETRKTTSVLASVLDCGLLMSRPILRDTTSNTLSVIGSCWRWSFSRCGGAAPTMQTSATTPTRLGRWKLQVRRGGTVSKANGVGGYAFCSFPLLGRGRIV